MQKQKNRGFSLVELIVVVVIIGILSGVAFVGIQKVRQKADNERMLDDLIAIANAMETYKQDHFGKYPDIKTQIGGKQNVLCFDGNAQYVHDCYAPEMTFIQGYVDNALLGKRYLPEVPVDPRTGSRYVYGMSADGQFYQVAGLWQNDDGGFEARTQDNLFKGFPLPSVIRAYDGPNFVVQRSKEFLPYNPNARVLVARAQNVTGSVIVTPVPGGTRCDVDPNKLCPGDLLAQENTIITTSDNGSVDLYFSDGSVTSLEPDTTLELKAMEVAENNKDSIITKITTHLSAGRIWNKVVRLSATSEFNVETTSAIAGVRGTEFGVIANGGTEQVMVRSGRVEIMEKPLLPETPPTISRGIVDGP
ncbi:MAG: FecR family protein, partial [Candidatus Peregrinibacteria bacterium]